MYVLSYNLDILESSAAESQSARICHTHAVSEHTSRKETLEAESGKGMSGRPRVLGFL